jgi:cystathionine beta-lyase/cystathionine gamma-synthase
MNGILTLNLQSGMLRVSPGIEHIEDLKADITAALRV